MSSCADDMREIRDSVLICFCNLFCTLIFPVIGYLFISLLVFLIFDPSLTFTLLDVKLYAFNISTATSTLTSDLRINISCRNDDTDADLHFDNITVYACYRNHQIALATMIPPAYIEEQNQNFTFRSGYGYQHLIPPVVTVWSPYLNGTEVPVTAYLAAALVQDETAGNVSIDVKVTGRLTSEFGFLSRRFRLKVSCPEYILFGDKHDSDVVGSAVKRPFAEGCHVEV